MQWKGLRTRPGGRRRHSSIVEPMKPPTSASEKGEKAHEPIGPLERLSLRLSNSPERLSNSPERPAAFTPEAARAGVAGAVAEDGANPQEPPKAPDPAERTRPAANRTESEKPATGVLRPQRFSLLKFRHASDSALSMSYRSADTPPLPSMPTPTIITTSPTTHQLDQPVKRRPKHAIFGRSNSPSRPKSSAHTLHSPADDARRSTQSLIVAPGTRSSSTPQHVSFDEPSRQSIVKVIGAPPAYGDESTSSLAIPVSRLSESSRSDGSSGEPGVYAQTTTTHTISTTTTFFRLPRRKKGKGKGPLFPLPVRIPPPDSSRSSISRTQIEHNSGRKSMSPGRRPFSVAGRVDNNESADQPSPLPSPTHSTLALTNAPFGSPGPAIVRKGSTASGASTPSVSLAPPRIAARGRSSTMGSLGRSVEEDEIRPQFPQSGRTSTSTTGRKSFGDIFSLSHRLRQNSEPPIQNGSTTSPGTPGSQSNSLQIPRETEPELVYPEREDNDTPASYLEKLEAAVPRGSMATILCKGGDDFSKTCLRKYMRGFAYFGDSVDVAVRKMLMEVELPKETQQIDRLLAGFADRYHECNPGIFSSTDEASIVAFSILLLHSDTHNKNNKRKMQKTDYVKNTQGPVQISHDVLECFYDNVCYTPFIHFEDEVALNSHRLAAPKPKRSLIRQKSVESIRGPVDPYTLILDNKLEVLRPSLKDVMDTEDTYSATGTAAAFDANDLHTAFAKSGVLQIVSARSRPDAFSNQATITNPAEAQMGLVSIKVAKVGLLWRKDPKKKKAKRPWQEWGAILTDSKLYFFRDIGWVKKLMVQQETYLQSPTKKGTLVFKPPLQSFDPDALMSMDDAIALMDSSYKKHKNAFTFIKHGGFEEILLANSEPEMNDWIAKLNYAATFRTANVRMRGMINASHGGEKLQIVRKDSEISTKSVDGQAADALTQIRSNDPHMAWEIMYYRRQIMSEKISDAEERLAGTQRELDNLLRNARHLQILLPFQAKTREALILAAGRMSAKLKWTRVDLWRTKCHRDILHMDLEQEGATAFPASLGRNASVATTPQKTTPHNISQQGHHGINTDTSTTVLSPISPASQQPQASSQAIIDRIKTPDHAQSISPETTPGTSRSRSVGGHELPRPVSGILGLVEESYEAKDEINPESHALVHQASIVSSYRSKDHERYTAPTSGLEGQHEHTSRDTSLGIDGAPSTKRPDTSGSDKDRVGAMSLNDLATRERGGSVRRSLHRTLRDSHHGHPTPHQHTRGKKSRESGSSLTISEDGIRSLGGESSELKRGTGSFIVHGKKASVITFGSEWQNMSNDDRLKLRKVVQDGDTKSEAVIEDGTASNVSGPSAVAEAEMKTEDSDMDRPTLSYSEATAVSSTFADLLDRPKSMDVTRSTSSHGSENSLHAGFSTPELMPSPRMEAVHG